MEKPKSKLWKKLIFALPFALLLFTFFLYFSLEKGAHNTNTDYTVMERSAYTSLEVFDAQRFVHLDLKGAPPKVSYYKNLFPLLSKLGATGLLIEYEDMFPYVGELLKDISAYNAYSFSDIETIISLAEENNLTVIPLVQTFGHLEFLLKLNKFSFLRETPKSPQVICPTHNMTLNILLEMIRQVIQAHPKSTMIHIGADEVYHLGECDRCKRFMFEEKISKQQLFLSHIKRIATSIKSENPNIKILMWDDEFRNIEIENLKFSAINFLIEPVIWKYSQDVYFDLGYDLFDTYSKVFNTLWFASAFKGATGSSQYLTLISHHVHNHDSWMKVYNDYKSKVSLPGIFITGWQRYDHFAVLCELLPVGIPSLAFSLAVLLGYNSKELYNFPEHIGSLLNCKNSYALLHVENGLPNCKYPGGEILDAVTAFHQLSQQYKSLKDQSRLQGWIASYNIQHNFSNPATIDSIVENLTDLLSQLTNANTYLTDTMLEVFDKYTVSEWHETYVKPIFDDINKMLDAANKLLLFSDWPRRPFL